MTPRQYAIALAVGAAASFAVSFLLAPFILSIYGCP